MSAGALAVRRRPPDHRGRNHELFPALDQRGWRSDTLLGFSFVGIHFNIVSHRLDPVTSLTSSGQQRLIQHLFKFLFFPVLAIPLIDYVLYIPS